MRYNMPTPCVPCLQLALETKRRIAAEVNELSAAREWSALREKNQELDSALRTTNTKLDECRPKAAQVLTERLCFAMGLIIHSVFYTTKTKRNYYFTTKPTKSWHAGRHKSLLIGTDYIMFWACVSPVSCLLSLLRISCKLTSTTVLCVSF